MVDFNLGETIGKAPEELTKLMILERRSFIIDALEGYYKFRHQGVQADSYVVISRIKALYYELAGTLERNLNAQELKELKEKLFQDKVTIEQAIEVFDRLQKFLDDKHVTRFDTRTQYIKTRTENENKVKGLK